MGFKNGNTFDVMLYNLAKSLAAVENASWEKVKLLYSYCPQMASDERFTIYPYSLDSLIALGTYYIESKFNHTEKIVPYLLNLLKGLISAKWFQEDSNSDVSYVEHFSFCLNTLLSQISIGISDIFIYQTNEIVNVYSSVVNDLRSGFLNTEQLKKLCSIKFPVFLGLAQSMMRYEDQETPYFSYLFPKQKVQVGIINQSNELSRVNSISTLCNKTEVINSKLTGFVFKRKHCVYPLENIMNIIEIVHSLLSEETLALFENVTNQLRRRPPSMSYVYFKHMNNIITSAAVLLYRDIVFQHSDLISCYNYVKDFIDSVFASVQKSELTCIDNVLVDCDERAVQKLKILVLTKVTCMELLSWTVKDAYDAESLCAQVTAFLRSKPNDKRIIIINTPYMICCMDILGALAEQFPTVSDICIRSLQEFLSTPSTLSKLYSEFLSTVNDMHLINEKVVSKTTWFEYRKFKEVQICANENLCKSLRSINKIDVNYIPGFLTKFSSLLFMDNSNPLYALIIENVLISLGHISYSVPTFSLTILQCYQQRLCRHSVESDIVIIHQLGNMLICNENMEVFMGALKTFSNIMLEVNVKSKAEMEHISKNVFNVLVIVAKKLKDQCKINAIFNRFLELFVQVGLDELRNTEAAQANSFTKTKRENLLQVIALLSKNMHYSNQFKKQQERLYQDFWLYYVLSKDALILHSTNDEYLKSIAPTLPTLVSDTATDHDLREFFYTSSLSKLKVTAAKQSALKSQIVNFLRNTGDIALLVNKLTLPQVLYIHSVCALEAIRIENSKETSISSLFCYLTNTKLQKDRYGMWQCICKVSEEIFKKFLKVLLSMERNGAREKILERHALMLLIYFNNVHPQIRHTADKFLSELIDSFPHLLWSRRVAWSILDILSVLHCSLIINPNDEVTSLSVPNSDCTISLMETKKAREEIFGDFVARSREIISEARKWAPAVINSHLQEYVNQEKHVFPKVDPTWIQQCAWTLLYSNEKSYIEISDMISSLMARSRFTGEVTGLLEKSNLSAVDFGKTLADEVWKACNLQNVSEYQVSLQRATAFAVMQPTLQIEIKRAVAASHVKFFTEETVNTAVHCWYWLCTAHPEFEIDFLIEMFEAWQYTINNKIGLFSKDEMNDTGNSVDSKENCDKSCPHNNWIDFIVVQISCSKYCYQDKLEMITSFLHYTLPIDIGRSEGIMSRSVETIIARFSILSSALSLLQADVPISSMERLIIRQRVYYSCLDFFCCMPTFPRRNGLHLKQNINILIKFWYVLYSDKKHIVKHSLIDEFQEKAICSLGRSKELKELFPTKLKSIDGVLLYNSLSVDYFNKRQLALCLVAEEIQFLSTWINPRLRSENNKIREWQTKTFSSDRAVHKFPKTAWDVNPALAVYLPIRLRRDERITSEVSNLVLSNPSAVSHVPQAMMLLATTENLQKDRRELVYLLTWAEADPQITLNLLAQNYPLSPYVSQYVLKNFLKFSGNTLVRYIPQLVQSLRYDTLGYIHKLLFALARKYPLFCHQLIWNIKANMYDDFNLSSKAILYDKLSTLYDEVINDLSGPEKLFYEREFEFVDRITEISFKIPRNLKREERKFACLKGLSAIKIKPGCYLPSSPDFIVCDVDYTSGTPLQSKARTPYMANFLVHKCSYEEVYRICMEVSMKQLTGTKLDEIAIDDLILGPKTWQRTIFKAADDVRQDILALQTIRYFKDIFQEIGLDVFLYPYSVVAVAPGMGVIECIPNAFSRDQLGKQTNVGLYDYFITTFGDEKSPRFQEAQRNFIKSVAAYSLVIFLLQIKDRHNGNIMVDDVGHIMHIDFGFMFESSPGGNLGFEPDMKLTEEMVMIMGGRMDAEPFQWFTELCVKGYLAVRHHSEHIITLVSLMLDSGLPCFRGQTIKLLRGRFAPNASDSEAADYIMTVIRNSCFNFRTVTYDMLQYLQNSIQY